MAMYNIYHGVGCTGAQYDYTRDFIDENEALYEAYERAIEDYKSYEGCHGIPSEEEITEEYCEENDIEFEDLTEDDFDDIHDLYIEEVESWISYKVVLADEDTDVEPDNRDYF